MHGGWMDGHMNAWWVDEWMDEWKRGRNDKHKSCRYHRKKKENFLPLTEIQLLER
jgi:hypothetical protein